MRTVRAVVSVAVACAACAGTASPVLAAKPATGSCPPSFNLGAVAIDDYLELPRTAAAIEAGVIDAEILRANVAGIDGNANDVVCVKLSTGDETNDRPFGEYIYNVVDDTARVPE
jgi:hypothetical protein